MNEDTRIYVAGHRGLVGSAIVRRLRAAGHRQLLLAERRELELTRQADVEQWFASHRPELVIMAAARVGGIHANSTYPAEFIHDNLAVQTHLIDAAYRHGARKLVFLGSSCIYPREAPQPISEDSLLTGPLEPTNEWYAIAKIAGIKMCQAYRRQYGFDAVSLMPTNIYGPGDNFELQNSHVLPALIAKFDAARRTGRSPVVIWGTGTPRREFLYVDDLADAVLFLARHYSEAAPINVGTGKDVTIRELATLVGRVTGYEGELTFDTTKPDGTPRKLLDIRRLTALGWQAATALEDGLRRTWEWYCANAAQLRR